MRSMQDIYDAVTALESAREHVANMIFDRMDELARRYNLDEMIYHSRPSYRRDGAAVNPVKLPGLEEMVDAYNDHVSNDGLVGSWTRKKGWA